MARTKSGKPTLSAKERADKSARELVATGGRRFNLRLSKEANDAVKVVMEKGGYADETSAINDTLIQRSKTLSE